MEYNSIDYKLNPAEKQSIERRLNELWLMVDFAERLSEKIKKAGFLDNVSREREALLVLFVRISEYKNTIAPQMSIIETDIYEMRCGLIDFNA